MAPGTRLLVVDDHQGFVDAMALFLNEWDNVELVGTASDPASAHDLLDRAACDVVVLAHPLAGDDVLPLARAILAARPATAVLVVSDGTLDGSMLDAVGMGVSGWVWRRDGLAELLTAVLVVARGDTHLPVEPVRSLLVDRIGRGPSDSYRAGHVRPLTTRESAVLEGLAAGLSRKEIGETLHLSPNTVRTHVRSIMRKFHVHSAPAAVEALRKGS